MKQPVQSISIKTVQNNSKIHSTAYISFVYIIFFNK